MSCRPPGRSSRPGDRAPRGAAAALVFAAALLLPASAGRAAVANPHVAAGDRTACLFCHVPGFETADPGDAALLEDTVEAVCLRCHVKTQCCAIGQQHTGVFIGYSHPSDLDAGDIKRESLPKTLPLQDGRLTCNTCHFHLRPEGRHHKLVRLVEFAGDGVQWTVLCQDCHRDM